MIKFKDYMENKDSLLNIDVDSNVYYNGYDCTCAANDYCRCSSISHIDIEGIDVSYYIEQGNKLLKSVIDQYCFDRIVRKSSLIETDNWSATIEAGWYGDELGTTILDNETFEDYKKTIENYLTCETDLEKIMFVLLLEYKELLPELQQDYKMVIKTVPIEKVNLGAIKHKNKVAKKDLTIYDKYILPRAVCIESNDKYRVIDGYHRITNALNNKMTEVSIISLEKC